MSSRRKRAKTEPKRHIAPFVVILIIAVFVGTISYGTIGALGLMQSWLTELPDVAEVEDFDISRKTTVYASDGVTVLASFYAQDREPVTPDQVSENAFKATVSIEDERFYEHEGVDPQGIARAAFVDLTGGSLQGASTITQQLVRQTILQQEMNETTLKRKVREAYLALELEKLYTKEELLMMYMNTINYGDGAWGIQSASKHYFNKNAIDLTIPEAALLAGIPQNPTYNNPVASPDKALSRRNSVLDRMYVNGHITEEQLNEYKAQELNLNIQSSSVDGIIRDPYFTSYVRHVLLEGGLLAGGNSQDMVFKSGLSVYTTIDLNLQQIAEEVCLEKEAQLGDEGVEVSLTSVNPRTGYILAMRGGKDFYKQQFNTGWQMQRQFGSTCKVFALVAALELGYAPTTAVSGASPLRIDDGSVDGWPVANYGGQNMSSSMTMASATWASSNTAYARIANKLGAKTVVDTAKKMGVTSPQSESLAFVLGGTGFNTLEMASAYGTLANGGVLMPTTPIAKILDYEGNVIYDHLADTVGKQAVSPEVAHAATEVLKGVVTGGTGTAANLGWQVSAGKTGTSDQFWDSTYIGYTPQMSTAVWIGDPHQLRPIADNSGGTNCCPVWYNFMSRALEGQEAQQFPDAANPSYDPKATFLSAEDLKKIEEEKKKDEEEAKKKEEEEKKKAEEAKKKEEEEKQKEEANDPKKPTEGEDSGGSGSEGGGSGSDGGSGETGGSGGSGGSGGGSGGSAEGGGNGGSG